MIPTLFSRQVRVCWKDEILLRRPLRTAPSKFFPEDYEAEVNGQVAVVRHYRGDDERFNSDLACLNYLWYRSLTCPQETPSQLT
jgi:hypothetical protein